MDMIRGSGMESDEVDCLACMNVRAIDRSAPRHQRQLVEGKTAPAEGCGFLSASGRSIALLM
ncbi:hypothetical protein CWO90_25875 [Bradyrhizobium sp. Leo121]|nr:hypothetical protein CWO90_25875 [Bradyrhizobium sp. Leo121]